MPEIGQTISHYRIIQKLGQGGMGEVFLAHDASLDRKVALKFLSESSQQDPSAQKRFLREAKSAAALDHPFVCQIYETGEMDGKAFIAMEYVVGKTLSQRLVEGPIVLKESLQIGVEIAEALEEAHAKGIIHRDLKPSNVMLTSQGHVKVMDFGLAKLAPAADQTAGNPREEDSTASSRLTRTGALIGTLAYMSPEQACGRPVDSRSDIFSFGVVLFEMLSGAHPFQRPSQIETLSAILHDPPPQLRVQSAAVPPALGAVLDKALAKDIHQRYQTVADLANEIRILREKLIPRQKPAWIKWTLAAALPLVVAAILGTWWIARRPPPSSRPSVSVLIADFQNETGETIFDGTLESNFAIDLEGAPFITLYSRGQGRAIGKEVKPGAVAFDGSLAQLVAMREGINIVVSGSISSRSGGYRISVQAIDAGTGKRITEHDVNVADKAGVLSAVARLAALIRRSLGDTTPESAQLAAGETFTAGSLEAAHQYARAQDMQWADKSDEAIEYYRKAIQIDPEFGRAYAGLATIHANRHQRAEAESKYMEAMKHLNRMSERERYRTRGSYYLMMRNPKAIEEFSALLAKYPADTAGISNLALAYFYVRDMPRAYQEIRHAVDQYPKAPFYRSNMALFAMYAGEFETAVREAKAVLAQNADDEYASVALALSELAQGNVDAARAEYERAGTRTVATVSIAALGLGDLALYEGRLTDAASILEKGIAGDLGNGDESAASYKLIALGQTRLIQGKVLAASEAAGRAIKGNKDENVAFAAASIYVEINLEAQAVALVQDLNKRLEPDPRAYAMLIEGEISLKHNKLNDAIRLFQEAQKLTDSWLGHLALGRAYLAARAFTEAHSEFDACLERRGEASAVFLNDLPSYRYFPIVHYYLGRTYEGLKNPAAAAEAYRAFLQIKGKSREDPLIADARNRLESQ